MANATMTKFGYPRTLVAETSSWTVQVRPQQPTLGSLVLCCKEPVQAFGALSPAAFADLQAVIQDTEAALGAFVGYRKINYLMLMMVDPDVHFHVVPRYEGERTYRGLTLPDAGWPGPPALGQAVAPDEEVLAALVADIQAHWPGRAA